MKHNWLVPLTLVWPAFSQVEVTYLANEGALLTAPGAKVLIDALFRDSLGDYVRHQETQARIETGKPPFDRITLALATRYHLDRWDAGAISRFLRMIRGQVRSLSPEKGVPTRHEAAGVSVEAVPLQHGATQNLGFRISLGNRVVMHLGDAEPNRVNFARLPASERPDVALLPFWWLLNEQGLDFLTRRWKPHHVIAVHLGAADAAKLADTVVANRPAVWVGARPGQSCSY